MLYIVGVLIMMVLIMGYIYMGMVGVKGVYGVMCIGYVDEVWVKEYYEFWYDDVKVGKILV